ncbi:unnamed protein product [Malus baccata var. baccata]
MLLLGGGGGAALGGGLIACQGSFKVCPDRSKYVYWDPLHLTEAANFIVARHVMDVHDEDFIPNGYLLISQKCSCLFHFWRLLS